MRRITPALGIILAAHASHLPAQTRGFLVRLGVDTFAVERMVTTGNTTTGMVVRHTPSTTVLKYTLTLNADGTTKSYEEGVFLADGSPAPAGPDGVAQARMTMSFVGDTVIREVVQNGQTVMKRSPAPKGTMPRIGGTSPYMQELAIREVKRAGTNKLLLYGWALEQEAPAPTTVNAIGADSAELVIAGFRRGFRLDNQGRLLRGDGSLTTVKLLITPIADANIASIANAWAAADAKGLGMGTPSTRDTVNARVGDASVWIDYGRPAKRGRAIWGKLVPFDTVWRFGANEAAQIKIDKTLDIGGTPVPAGYYSVWLLPSAGQSYLILNTVTKQWGTMYDASKDLVRIPVRKHVGPPRGEERFRVLVQGDKLFMLWDDGGFEVDLRAK